MSGERFDFISVSRRELFPEVQYKHPVDEIASSRYTNCIC
jgi:hypothetical protein